ncbi:hypothetical protein D9M73_248010 [compost metagenome]
MRHLFGLLLQGAACVGQLYHHYPFIFAAAVALQQAFAFQALEQRGQRARVGQQVLADFAHGQAVTLPEHEHGKVLRVGQAQRLQQRLVDLGHQQRGGVQGETDLVVQQQLVTGGLGVGVHAGP